MLQWSFSAVANLRSISLKVGTQSVTLKEALTLRFGQVQSEYLRMSVSQAHGCPALIQTPGHLSVASLSV